MIIVPHTKVGDLLDEYPQLENTLLKLSPTFSKLKNPIIRKTIGKVATLQQVAVVGNLKIDVLINALRKEIGQEELNLGAEGFNSSSHKPVWFEQKKITTSLNVTENINKGESPMGIILEKVKTLENGKIMELITPFVPAPIIEKIEEMGLKSWSKKESETIVKNYFIKE